MQVVRPRLNLLVVEDNDDLRCAISEAFEAAGHHVVAVESAEAAVERADLTHIDIVILDLNLPGEDGLSFAVRLRKSQPAIGIIMLTARNRSEDKCIGFDLGADIYLTKPVPLNELQAAIRSLGRRVRHVGDEVLRLDVRQLQISGLAQPIGLTPGETALLSAFVRASQQELENWQIAELLGMNLNGFNKSALELHLVRLRKKLQQAGVVGATVKVVRGWGYKLCTVIHLT
jgi:DNA-binding response OmpR family regulator